VKNRFQNLPFKRNLHRYNAAAGNKLKAKDGDGNGGGIPTAKKVADPAVGQCTLTPPDPTLKGAWFQPLDLSSEQPVSEFAFRKMQLAPLPGGASGAELLQLQPQDQREGRAAPHPAHVRRLQRRRRDGHRHRWGNGDVGGKGAH
jgi:hypothetical protein